MAHRQAAGPVVKLKYIHATHMLVEFLSKDVSAGGPAAEQFQGLLRQAHGPHAVVQAARSQPALGDFEAAALSCGLSARQQVRMARALTFDPHTRNVRGVRATHPG